MWIGKGIMQDILPMEHLVLKNIIFFSIKAHCQLTIIFILNMQADMPNQTV